MENFGAQGRAVCPGCQYRTSVMKTRVRQFMLLGNFLNNHRAHDVGLVHCHRIEKKKGNFSLLADQVDVQIGAYKTVE